MFSNSRLQTIVLTSDMTQAVRFYKDVLELKVIGESDGSVVFDVGGSDLRVSPVPSTRPSEHTVLGFAVSNVETAIKYLDKKGIITERFKHLAHQANGIVVTPEGSRVVLIRDPDGNLLSVVQFRTDSDAPANMAYESSWNLPR